MFVCSENAELGLVFVCSGCQCGVNACSGMFLCSLCSEGVFEVVFGSVRLPLLIQYCVSLNACSRVRGRAKVYYAM